MIDKKISLITIHDVNPSCVEKLQKITDELNKLNIKYNLSIVPNYKNSFTSIAVLAVNIFAVYNDTTKYKFDGASWSLFVSDNTNGCKFDVYNN